MFSKLALRNVRRSFRDYGVYLLTLTFGVCLFYTFNSIDGQGVMVYLAQSQNPMAQLIQTILDIFSVFVAVVLACLILYANTFLIRRRKRELGTYLLLGLSQRQVSGLLVLETLVIGLISLAAGLLFALRAELPDTFVLEQGQPLAVESMPFLQAAPAVPAGSAAPAGVTAADKSANVTLTLLGLPVKTVRTVQQQRRTVQLGGTPFGVKMFTDGALVVAFSDIYTVHGSENPAKEAGLRLGDLITQANGIPVRTNEELTDAIAAAAGGSVELRYLRGQNQMICTLTPVRERGTDAPRAGIWVRDSSAGIGTLTFADTEHGTFAGLGHAVSDSDTGTDLTLLTGEAVSVTITGCRRGSAGSPGELRGEFGGQQPFGDIKANTSTGVYGVLTNSAQAGENIPVANLQEVYPGEAEIVTTISGQTAQRFAVRIERVNMTASDPNRNLLLRITDPELLRATGGIVQGMSGSPIVQDGCLVGAVTHVLVNDPTRGYGIFAATMLKRADAVQGR